MTNPAFPRCTCSQRSGQHANSCAVMTAIKTNQAKRGRPPILGPNGAGGRIQVNLRVSADEDPAFTARAAALGLSVSMWLRMLGRRDCGLPTPMRRGR